MRIRTMPVQHLTKSVTTHKWSVSFNALTAWLTLSAPDDGAMRTTMPVVSRMRDAFSSP